MDLLEDLPIDKTQKLNPLQQSVFESFSGERTDPNLGQNPSDTVTPAWKDASKWKILAVATLTYLAVSNPIFQSILEKIPFVGGESGSIKSTLVSTGIFLIIVAVVVMFAV